MKQNGCKYSSANADRSGVEKGIRCGNAAHRDGMCKFHLNGYLSRRTVGEMRDMFWKQHDGTAEGSTVNCNGYILPSLAQAGGPHTVRRRLCLDNAVFGPDCADLSGIAFEQPATFKNARFEGGVNFRRCIFKRGADFSRAVFSGAAKFEGVAFSEHARFARARFDKATFDWARLAAADFQLSIFRKAASFHDSEFADAADFRRAEFRSKSDFTDSEFADAADFRRAEFRSMSDFTDSEFADAADFGGAEFAGPMHFRGVRAERPVLIRFDGNVSNVSFLDTDLKEITFGSRITWSPLTVGSSGPGRGRWVPPRHGGYSIWNNKWRIYDEKIIEGNSRDPALNVENLKGVYRDMRDNFDRCLAYNVSGGLFAREMEVERKYENDKNGCIKRKHIIKRALTWHIAYSALSEYGQSLARPLLCLAAVFGAGLSLLWCPAEIPFAPGISCGASLVDSTLRVLMAMVPVPLSASNPPVDLALKVASLPASATFLLALRRRFAKSRRH